MTDFPETRASLLLRAGNPGDAAAWRELAALYRPAVYRIARRRGLQDADAEDLAQRVLVAISRNIAEWRPTTPTGSFRAWVSVIARNLAINALTRGRLGTGLGGTSVIDWLENHPAPDDEARDVDDEFRRALFRHAAEKIRPEFRDSTWQAFWLTAVEGLSVDDAARQLGKSVGVIYTGRSRVMRRLREAVREIEEAGS